MNRSNTSPRSFSTDQLHAALGDAGGPARPDYLPDIVAQAGRMRQRPAWTFLERWVSMDIAVRRQGVPRAVVVFASLFLLVALLAAGVVYIGSQRTQPERPPGLPLGIFEPAAGRIVFQHWGTDGYAPGLWAVDPSAPSVATMVRASPERDMPIGWSSDGTRLLFTRRDRENDIPVVRHLFILHADGTETQVTPEPVGGAAISPDGSRVVYSADGLYVVDADGGQPVQIAAVGDDPTFSPDGTQIAYLAGVQTGRAHVRVANADGTDAHAILADEPALAQGGSRLTWSPAGDRIAMQNDLEDVLEIYTFAPDGSDFKTVISGGMNPFWSPDGSQIAYTIPYDVPLGESPGLAIAAADGSNVREFGFAGSGPWHPGTLESAPEPTSSSSAPSVPPLTERFGSTVHGISIDYPAGWQTRPATEPWSGGELSFDSPAADVIFDPALGDGVYLILASQPYGNLSQDEWDRGVTEWLCTGAMEAGSYRFDGARAWAVRCPAVATPTDDSLGHGGIFVFTDTRGYLIRRVVASDEPGLAEAYGWDWLKLVLETVDLRPEQALDSPSLSPSP